MVRSGSLEIDRDNGADGRVAEIAVGPPTLALERAIAGAVATGWAGGHLEFRRACPGPASPKRIVLLVPSVIDSDAHGWLRGIADPRGPGCLAKDTLVGAELNGSAVGLAAERVIGAGSECSDHRRVAGVGDRQGRHRPSQQRPQKTADPAMSPSLGHQNR